MTLPEIPKPEIINQAFEWLYRVSALRAAVELNLWEKIATGADTAAKISAQEGWNLAGTRLLLDAVCALKLLAKEGDRYVLVPESALYLLPGKPTYKGAMLENDYNWERNVKLSEAIRSGRRPFCYDATSAGMVSKWITDYSCAWVYPQSYLPTLDKMWQSLEIQARDGLRVLDVACGPVPCSLALARRHPGVCLTWLDREAILQTALKVAAGLEAANQVSLLPGDLWQVDFGSRAFDVAYLGDVTHFFSPEENVHLFRKVHAALAPGGMIIVNSVARRENESSIWDALWLYAATASGGAYDFAEYQSMLVSVGFKDIEDINNGPVKARKP